MAENESIAGAPDAPLPEGSQTSRLAEAPAKAAAPQGDRPETVIPSNWAPNLLVYADISRMLFRMHRNVAVHMEAHKRLAERMQSVFAHEQAMVLELAKLIDEGMAVAARRSNEEKPPLGNENIDKIFEHASKAMTETGRMLTDIQLESLKLLQHYIAQSSEGGTATAPTSEAKKGTGKK